MQIDTDRITKRQLEKLKSILNRYLADGVLPEGLSTEEDIQAVIAFFSSLSEKNDKLRNAIRKSMLGKTEDPKSVLEKTAHAIARSQIVDQIIGNKSRSDPKLFNSFLRKVTGGMDEERKQIAMFVAKREYKKTRNRLRAKVNRIAASRKVLELAEKHPDTDIVRVVQLAVAMEMLDVTYESMDFLDRIIGMVREGTLSDD